MPPEDPFLIRRADFLRDISRSEQWYRDRVDDPRLAPPLPKTIHQGKDAFVRTEAGLPVVGRPPLAVADSLER